MLTVLDEHCGILILYITGGSDPPPEGGARDAGTFAPAVGQRGRARWCEGNGRTAVEVGAAVRRSRMTHHDVVLCHASEDAPIAERVAAILEQEGIPCWVAPRDVEAGVPDGDAAVLRAIASSRLVVLVFSRHADASTHVPLELDAAASRGIPVVPVRVEEATPSGSLQHVLEGSHWLDAVAPPMDDHLHHLAGYVSALLERADEPTPVALPATAPSDPWRSPYGPAPDVAPRDEPPPGSSSPGAPAPVPGPFPGDAPPTPPGRRPSGARWLFIALGAVGLVVFGALVTFAILFAIPDPADQAQTGNETESGSAPGSDDAPSGGGADADPDAVLAERSCELLDPADLDAIYGTGAGGATPSTDGFCDFAGGGITIVEEPANSSSLELYRDVTPTEITDLRDLGEGAFMDADGLLFVLDEDRDALLLLVAYDNSQTGREQLVELAERTVD